MVAGGANFMVEALRMAMNDTSELLAQKTDASKINPMILPKKVVVQLDNCSENKVSNSPYIVSIIRHSYHFLHFSVILLARTD